MKVSIPHWLTLTISAVGICAGGLAAAHLFPAFDGLLSLVAAICAAGAAPTITTGDKS